MIVRVLCAVLCVMVLCDTASSGASAFAVYQAYQAYQIYERAYALGKSGIQHFKNARADLSLVALHPFDTTNIVHARGEFAGALREFTQIQTILQRIPSVLVSAPSVGSKLAGAKRLAPIAVEAAQGRNTRM